MWSSNGKSCCAFLSFWLDPSRPLIKWYDPFAWSIKNQLIPFVRVLVRSLADSHPFLKTGIFEKWPSQNERFTGRSLQIHQRCLFFNNSYYVSESSIITHKTISLTPCLVESFYLSPRLFEQSICRKNTASGHFIHTLSPKRNITELSDRFNIQSMYSLLNLDQLLQNSPAFPPGFTQHFLYQHHIWGWAASSESVASVSPVVLPFGSLGARGCDQKISSCNETHSLIPCWNFLNPGKHLQKTAASFGNSQP